MLRIFHLRILSSSTRKRSCVPFRCLEHNALHQWHLRPHDVAPLYNQHGVQCMLEVNAPGLAELEQCKKIDLALATQQHQLLLFELLEKEHRENSLTVTRTPPRGKSLPNSLTMT